MQESSSLLEQLTVFKVGARVAASGFIFYAGDDVEVDEGTPGWVSRVTHGGALLHVRWDGRDDELATSFDAVLLLREVAPNRAAAIDELDTLMRALLEDEEDDLP